MLPCMHASSEHDALAHACMLLACPCMLELSRSKLQDMLLTVLFHYVEGHATRARIRSCLRAKNKMLSSKE